MFQLIKKKGPDINALIAKDLITQVIALLPSEPHVLNGHWSWADATIDLVFPDLALTEKKTERPVSSGLAVHVARSEDLKGEAPLVVKCRELGVPLLLLACRPSTDEELISRIEAVFDNRFSIRA